MMKYRSITFNNKNSIDDFGLYVSSCSLDDIEKERVTKKIPYKNGVIDFSRLYGESVFPERPLEYTFDILAEDSEELERIKSKIKSWLLTVGELNLYDSSIIGTHFKAECVNVSFSDDYDYSFCTASFKAYPYKIGNNKENEDWIWDTFNFETDVINKTVYSITEETEIDLYNISDHKVIPEVKVTGNIEIEHNGIVYQLSEGTYNSYRFKLDMGKNTFILRGNGTIQFNWYREVF